METKKNNKKLILGVVALVAVIAIFAIVYAVFAPKAVEGSKAITIEVVNKEGESTTYELKTDAEYLVQAMEELQAQNKGFSFQGDETEYGLTINAVNGEVADFNAGGAYWSIMVNDEYGMYGASAQPVLDGEKYAFVYCVYTGQ